MKKKRCLLWLLSVTFVILAKAQTSQLEYHLFAEEGKSWETQVGGIKENVYGNQINGDTIINGESWKKVYNYVGFPECSYTYYAAIRDFGKKVYAIAKGSTNQRLLYDFDLKEGDIVKCGVEGNVFGCILDKDEKSDTLLGFPFVSYLRVESIDTIKARNLVYRYFTFSLLDSFKEYYKKGEESVLDNVVWVEGVGSGAGPFSPWMPLPPRGSILQGCEINKTCIFGFPDFYEREKATDVNSIQPDKENNISVYDLVGRILSSKSKTGIYIQDGKKVIR
jgi:hypothetical protein